MRYFRTIYSRTIVFDAGLLGNGICGIGIVSGNYFYFYTSIVYFSENLLNVFIDESGKDIPRLCLCSYDPDTYFNPDSEIFNLQNK